ncbi:sensor histidine kinase [Evansella halocellulosilytica]|uniref:sensor histidine kinase n=1 Tax=Evansella halocellulosilytica TaxID=2011013 RepID=UPI000BB96BB1|nr:HAMP domain-containing sensor histidine kinase [Evansella halocellulosilytica]
MNIFYRSIIFSFLFILSVFFLVSLSVVLIVVFLILMMEIFPFLNNIDIKIYYFFVLLFVLLLFSYMMGWLIGKPSLAIIEWLKGLSEGNFEINFYLEKFSFLWNKKNNLKVYYFPFKGILLFLNELTISLQQHQYQIEKSSNLKEQWIAGVSHDIKTPLSYIKGYLDIMSSDDLEMTYHERKQAIHILKQKVNDIEGLMNMFQVKQSQDIIQKVKSDLVSFLKELILDVANNPKSSQYTFTFESRASTYHYYFDQKMIKRIMQNLLMNAVLHNPPETKVVVKLEITKQVNIKVIDNGTGIDPSIIQHVYTQQSKKRVNTSEKEGLGLVVVKELVEKHQGSLHIDTNPNKGTIVTIELHKSG